MELPLPAAVAEVADLARKTRPTETRWLNAKRRPRCGVRTRSTGAPCRGRATWNRKLGRPFNGRCKFHGGATREWAEAERRKRAKRARREARAG